MMKANIDRRSFLIRSAMAGVGIGIQRTGLAFPGGHVAAEGKRIGIIGLDTSHVVAFTNELNAESPSTEYGGYSVVAAFPQGSLDIDSSVKRIPGYTEDVKKKGVEIVDSIPDLLGKADVVLLETNDGRRHLEQAVPVLKAGKPLFIDKPVAASLADAIVIFELAKRYHVPVFSSSSLRFIQTAQDVVHGKVGKILGADTYGPSSLEKTHPDFFWYGIHGVELLYTVMGPGCKKISRQHTEGTDVAVGIWEDGRIGSFRGTRTGQYDFGGTVFGEKGNCTLGSYDGYKSLLVEIIKMFQSHILPVKAEETLEICAFMEAADESKRRDGAPVNLDDIWSKARKKAAKALRNLI